MKVINHNLLWIYEIYHAYSKRKISNLFQFLEDVFVYHI